MATVIVNSPNDVLVDGDAFGAVADTIANNPQLASDIQVALQAKWSEIVSSSQAIVSAVTAEREQALSDLSFLREAALSGNPEAIAAALVPHKEKEIIAIDLQIAELEAKKLALEDKVVAVIVTEKSTKRSS